MKTKEDINTLLINSLTIFVKSSIRIQIANLEKCKKCELRPATVTHKFIDNLICCDHCAAGLIVSSGHALLENALKNKDDNLNEIRESLVNEDFWLDKPVAADIRAVLAFAEINYPEMFLSIH